MDFFSHIYTYQGKYIFCASVFWKFTNMILYHKSFLSFPLRYLFLRSVSDASAWWSVTWVGHLGLTGYTVYTSLPGLFCEGLKTWRCCKPCACFPLHLVRSLLGLSQEWNFWLRNAYTCNVTVGLHLLPEWLGLSTCTVAEDEGPSSASSLSNYANMMGVGEWRDVLLFAIQFFDCILTGFFVNCVFLSFPHISPLIFLLGFLEFYPVIECPYVLSHVFTSQIILSVTFFIK